VRRTDFARYSEPSGLEASQLGFKQRSTPFASIVDGKSRDPQGFDAEETGVCRPK